MIEVLEVCVRGLFVWMFVNVVFFVKEVFVLIFLDVVIFELLEIKILLRNIC